MEFDGLAGMLVIVASFLTFVQARDWSYSGSTGYEHWKQSYKICGKKSQSPIDFPDKVKMAYDKQLKPIMIKGLDNPNNQLDLFNNGHAAQVNVNGDVSVEGGNLPNRFKLAQFHFHWGHESRQGSEHLYKGKAYPLELHIVNYNEKYGSLKNAMNKTGDGLAVLGFWFEESSVDNPMLVPLISKLDEIKRADERNKITVKNLKLGSMISGKLDRYYRYSGSLTTPPCFESVIWSVFDSKIAASTAQLNAFRALKEAGHGNHANKLVDNFRPPQPLNGRNITRSFSGAPSLNCKHCLLVIMSCTVLLWISGAN